MANIPKLRLMLARMEKTASARWRTLQGLTALLGKDVVNEFPRIGALQLAAKQQGIKLPGEGFAKALDSLPRGLAGAQLPPEILKSAAELDKEAGIADIANRVLSTLIKSPVTPSFVKNTFYPGFPVWRS